MSDFNGGEPCNNSNLKEHNEGTIPCAPSGLGKEVDCPNPRDIQNGLLERSNIMKQEEDSVTEHQVSDYSVLDNYSSNKGGSWKVFSKTFFHKDGESQNIDAPCVNIDGDEIESIAHPNCNESGDGNNGSIFEMKHDRTPDNWEDRISDVSDHKSDVCSSFGTDIFQSSSPPAVRWGTTEHIHKEDNKVMEISSCSEGMSGKHNRNKVVYSTPAYEHLSGICSTTCNAFETHEPSAGIDGFGLLSIWDIIVPQEDNHCLDKNLKYERIADAEAFSNEKFQCAEMDSSGTTGVISTVNIKKGKDIKVSGGENEAIIGENVNGVQGSVTSPNSVHIQKENNSTNGHGRVNVDKGTSLHSLPYSSPLLHDSEMISRNHNRQGNILGSYKIPFQTDSLRKLLPQVVTETKPITSTSRKTISMLSREKDDFSGTRSDGERRFPNTVTVNDVEVVEGSNIVALCSHTKADSASDVYKATQNFSLLQESEDKYCNKVPLNTYQNGMYASTTLTNLNHANSQSFTAAIPPYKYAQVTSSSDSSQAHVFIDDHTNNPNPYTLAMDMHSQQQQLLLMTCHLQNRLMMHTLGEQPGILIQDPISESAQILSNLTLGENISSHSQYKTLAKSTNKSKEKELCDAQVPAMLEKITVGSPKKTRPQVCNEEEKQIYLAASGSHSDHCQRELCESELKDILKKVHDVPSSCYQRAEPSSQRELSERELNDILKKVPSSCYQRAEPSSQRELSDITDNQLKNDLKKVPTSCFKKTEPSQGELSERELNEILKKVPSSYQRKEPSQKELSDNQLNDTLKKVTSTCYQRIEHSLHHKIPTYKHKKTDFQKLQNNCLNDQQMQTIIKKIPLFPPEAENWGYGISQENPPSQENWAGGLRQDKKASSNLSLTHQLIDSRIEQTYDHECGTYGIKDKQTSNPKMATFHPTGKSVHTFPLSLSRIKVNEKMCIPCREPRTRSRCWNPAAQCKDFIKTSIVPRNQGIDTHAVRTWAVNDELSERNATAIAGNSNTTTRRSSSINLRQERKTATMGYSDQIDTACKIKSLPVGLPLAPAQAFKTYNHGDDKSKVVPKIVSRTSSISGISERRKVIDSEVFHEILDYPTGNKNVLYERTDKPEIFNYSNLCILPRTVSEQTNYSNHCDLLQRPVGAHTGTNAINVTKNLVNPPSLKQKVFRAKRGRPTDVSVLVKVAISRLKQAELKKSSATDLTKESVKLKKYFALSKRPILHCLKK